ncbi:MAG: lipoprotein-releasing system transmembrane subunit LolC [Pelagibacterales bacterium]|nr:lipoprotein-releasing system transmembrane subunit LolC [Pelagibacterales bacterium]
MLYSYELWIAYRYLRARRVDGFISIVSWFSLIGISLGVATLIIVMSVMNGFREELLSRIIGLNGHATFYVNNNSESINADNIEKILLGFDEVFDVVSLVESTVMISNKKQSRGVVVRGLSINDLKENALLEKSISVKVLTNFNDENTIILGKRLATSLQLKRGDNVTIISSSGLSTPFGDAPMAKNFIVAGIFDLGMYEYDSSVIFMKINNLRDFLGYNNNYIDNIELFYKSPENSDLITYNIKDTLNSIETGNIIIPWTQRHAQLFSALEVERNVMFIILTLIILVAAFNIISSMIMLVKDKESSISILRTMGISENSILKIFIIVGASIGIIGTVIGFTIGLLFSLNIQKIQKLLEGITGTNLFAAEIYFLSKLPAKIDFTEVGLVVLFALILSLLATLYPAWRASRIDPIKVLRNA